MMTCDDRAAVRNRTQRRLRETDWGERANEVFDRSSRPRRQDRQTETARHLLQRAVDDGQDLFLFLEDDLEFNAHLRWNLEHWSVFEGRRSGDPFFGSLYNPNVVATGSAEEDTDFVVADEHKVYGSQALVLSATTARFAIEHWEEVAGMQDIKLSRLAARLCRVIYHRPSLVQHVGRTSTWGGHFHTAVDYTEGWRAEVG